MNRDQVVSEIDINHLELLRNNVRKLIKNCSKQFDKVNNHILDIAPQDHGGAKEFFNLAKITTLDLDPESGANLIADLCEDNSESINSEQFDLIICTEVLEHTLNPFDAAKEIYRLLKTGGTAAVSTPFNFRIHGPLPDCWRFTEYGLKELFKNFNNVEIVPLQTRERDLMPIHYTLIAKK